MISDESTEGKFGTGMEWEIYGDEDVWLELSFFLPVSAREMTRISKFERERENYKRR